MAVHIGRIAPLVVLALWLAAAHSHEAVAGGLLVLIRQLRLQLELVPVVVLDSVCLP
jgi:hypothetical protein